MGRSTLKRRDFQETLGLVIVQKEFILLRSRGGKPVKFPSLIKIGQEKKTYEFTEALTTNRDTIALTARLAGTLDEFKRVTLYLDSKYPYLSSEDRGFNKWLEYRNKLRDVREGYRIGSHSYESKLKMMAGIIKAYKGKVNTQRHERFISLANRKLSQI